MILPSTTQRLAGTIATVAGLGSLGLLLYAARRNESRLLMTFFALWVASPFVALFWANMVSKTWSRIRTALFGMTLVIAVTSLAVYGNVALHPPRAQAAFAFIAIPPASWLLIAIVVPIAMVVSRRRSHRAV